MQVIVDSEKATEITVDGIFLVVQHTGRWSRMAQCFGDLESVQEALIHLYVQVLDFLQCATKRFQKGSWGELYFLYSLFLQSKARCSATSRVLRSRIRYLTLNTTIARVRKSIYTSAKDKFATKLTKLREAAERFDKTAHWESMFRTPSLMS
jgi:hypothetical protein